ncbi:MAG: hypothetical protein QM760_21345 [Nibricoccus sp.]
MKTNSQGSTLSVVMMSTVFVSVLAISVIGLINTQRRVNIQRELQLQANAAAETALDYAYSYIINDIQQNTLANSATVPRTGYSAFTFPTTVQSFLLGSVTLPTGLTGTPGTMTLENLEVRVCAPTAKKRYYVDGKDPGNAADPNKNQWVNESLIPIVARVTAKQGSQKYTAYVQKAVSSREIALFQYSIFFQGQLHLHRGFRPMGGIHANGNLFLNAHSGDGAVYNGAVTTASYFYRGSSFDQGGTGADAFGYTPVNSIGKLDFTISGVAPVATGGGGDIKIYTESSGSTHYYANVENTMDSRLSTWKDSATATFKDHLQDISHMVPELVPVGSEGYRQDVKATTGVNEFNNAPYALIEPNLPVSHASHKSTLENSLEAKASLIFLIEFNEDATIALHQTFPNNAAADILNTAVGTNNRKFLIDTDADGVLGGSEPRVSNPWRTFVVRAYKVSPDWDRALGTDIHGANAGGTPYLTAVPLPKGVIGAANSTCTYVTGDGKFEEYEVLLPNATSATAIGDNRTSYTTYDTQATTSLATIKGTLTTAQKNILNSTSTSTGTSTQQVTMAKGLFDSRMGRGVVPITIDIAKLRFVLEAPLARLTDPADIAFRTAFDPTSTVGPATAPRKLWNGLLYVEFPTSLELQSATGVATNLLPLVGTAGTPVSTRRFAYGTMEKRHPDRWFNYDHLSRGDRADTVVTATNPKPGIVPIAPELRDYPDSTYGIVAADYYKNSTILNERYAIPALQIINGRQLPHPNSGDTAEGFTIATNAPVYLVGNYNSDGDYTTGTNISSTSPEAYSEKDTAITEIPAAIFCDTFTILSNGWAEKPGGVLSNRETSFYGSNNASTATNGSPGRIGAPPGRPIRTRAALNPYAGATNNDGTALVIPATNKYVEISACVATGEYPIFEFFTHCLENWASSGAPTPIIIKGSMVGMYHGEIQHIKQAYDRDINEDIQTYWQQHGANAFVSSRYHRMLLDGNFPPGTPMAYVTAPKEFRLLRKGDTTDNAAISGAGF